MHALHASLMQHVGSSQLHVSRQHLVLKDLMGLSTVLQVWKTPALTKTGWRSPASASRRASTSDSALSPRRTADEVAAEVGILRTAHKASCG